jgi:hypothetical protein
MRVKRVTVEAGFSEGEPYGAWAIAASGMVSLALAMGLGRFIYAPLLPAMLLEGSLTLSQGGTLAMMNYVGYFIGALLAFWMRPDPARMVRISLILTIVLVPGMALHKVFCCGWPCACFPASTVPSQWSTRQRGASNGCSISVGLN